MANTIGLDDFHAAREPQARADAIYRAFDSRAPAPRVLEGESPLGYRQRVAFDLKRHSPAWKDVDVRSLSSAVFAVAEAQIYQDAEREALHPTTFRPGELRAVVSMDGAGRPVTRYVGDPAACWAQFKLPIRYVRRFNTGAAR